MAPNMTVPKAFISYSHDDQEHKKWVLDLATRLRNNGVDAVLDQWSLGPGDDLPHFMESNLRIADRVLMVCSDNYVAKANQGAGGVGYEKMIVTAELLKNISSNKLIPLIRQSGSHNVPTFMGSKYFIDFSSTDQFEFSFDELIRSLHKSPLYEMPPVANNPFAPVAQTPPDKVGDGVMKVMKILVSKFERTSDPYVSYSNFVDGVMISRIWLDIFLEEAEGQGLIERSTTRAIYLLPKGRMYAVQHGLVTPI